MHRHMNRKKGKLRQIQLILFNKMSALKVSQDLMVKREKSCTPKPSNRKKRNPVVQPLDNLYPGSTC